jgi:hypothetical protein
VSLCYCFHLLFCLVSKQRLHIVLISIVVCGCRAQANLPPATSKRDAQDMEMDDLRGQIEHYETSKHDAPHDSDVDVSSNDEDDVNPFHQDRSHTLSDSTLPHPQNLRIHGVQHHYDVKVDILEFEGRMQPDEFIDWLNTIK